MESRFRSIQNPNIFYVVSSSFAYEYRAEQGISEKVKQFDTMGDGSTQHTPLYPVPVGQTTDFLESYALHLANHEANGEEIEPLVYVLTSPVNGKDIDFMEGIKYQENKGRYYSLSERKVGSSEKLRHDKRYERIESWQKGTFQNTFQLALEAHRYRDPLAKLAIYFFTFDYLNKKHDCYSSDYDFTAQFANGPDYDDQARLTRAFKLIMYFVELWQVKRQIACEIGNLNRYLDRDKVKDQEKEAA